MIPTSRLALLMLVPLSLSLAYQFVPPSVAALAAVDALLIVVAAADLLLNTGRVDVERRHVPVWSVGERTAVTLRLHNPGARRLRLRVMDDAPGETDGLPAELTLEPGEAHELTYGCRIDERGLHRFGTIPVRWRSPLGLWEQQQRTEAASEVRVYPEFTHLRRYGLQARNDEQRLPVRARRRPGGENEFQRLRGYVPGDAYRHIDWKASARRQKFIVREYGQESNQNVLLLIDGGRMMGMRLGKRTAFDHALDAALAMGDAALRHGDRVGLLVFDQQVRAWLPPKGGARNGNRLIQATYDVFPSEAEVDFAAAFRHLNATVRRRSLVVLLTAVQDEVTAEHARAVVRAMAGRHLPLCVWLRDPELTELSEGPVEDEDGWYLRGAASELVAWRERALIDLRRSGALVVDCAPDVLTPELLGSYLEIKARRLL